MIASRWLWFLTMVAFTALFVPGCGSQEPPFGNTPLTTPVASSGHAVLTGVCLSTRDECASISTALVQIVNADGSPVFEQVIPMGGQYEAQLLPGTYTLHVQALPCLFSQSFTIALGDAMIMDALLF